jgi:hypothetical protein
MNMAQSRRDAQRAFDNDTREQPDKDNRVARGNNAENLGRGQARKEIARRADPGRPAAQRRH